MMYNPNINPILGDPALCSTVSFAQTRESLLDTEEYMHFIYSVENQFRKSRFYKDYKCSIMSKGLNFDQEMRAINSDMATIELHHHLSELKDAAIVITEYFLNTVGKCTTFDVIGKLIEAHRMNIMGVVMLTETNHQLYSNDPSAHIGINQVYGNFWAFLDAYGKYFTLDIAYKWLLQFKQDEQYAGSTHWPMIARARQQLLDWHNSGYIQY